VYSGLNFVKEINVEVGNSFESLEWIDSMYKRG